MIWTFILASALAFASYFLGAYFVKVAVYTGIMKIGVLLAIGLAIFLLYRWFTRCRSAGVGRIPRL